jgi:hypothetical protein
MIQDGFGRMGLRLRQLRGTVLVLLALPLGPALLASLLSGDQRMMLGNILGIGLLVLALRLLRRGRIRPAAIATALATAFVAHLAAQLSPLGAVIFGAIAFFGASLLYADAPAPELPPEPAPPPAPDPLDLPRARFAALSGADSRLHPAICAAQGLLQELEQRPGTLPDARRFLSLQLDGLERIESRLRAGAIPPESLPMLIDDMARGSTAMRDRLRTAETEALEIQVKVLADRLRQEGYA